MPLPFIQQYEGDKKVSEAVDTLKSNDNPGKEGIGDFVRHTREELDNVTFPSSDYVKNTVIIVIISVIFFAVYLFLVDQAWTYILEGLSWLANKVVGA